MMGRRVLILGGSRYMLRSVAAARRAGFTVLVADRDPLAPAAAVADVFLPIDIADSAAVEDAARRHAVEGIVPLNDVGVLTAANVTHALGLVGLAPEVALRCCRKDLMRQAWQAAGLPNPRFELAEDETAIRAAITRIGLPCVLKPARGIRGGSRGVVAIHDPATIEDAIAFTLSFYPDKATLVEEFIAGESEHSAEVLIADGHAQVIAIGDKVKSPLPYRVDREVIYPTTLGGERRQKAEEVIIASVLSLGVPLGAAHVEFAMTGRGPVLFELGARCGGGGTPDPIVTHVSGLDVIAEVIDLHLGRKTLPLGQGVQKGAVYRFLFPPPGHLTRAWGLEAARATPGVADADVLVPQGGEIVPVRVGPDRAGFIIALADTRENALAICDRAERLIHFV